MLNIYAFLAVFLFLPASELMLSPAPAPAARDCRAPREAMGFTEELLLEVGEEPAFQTKKKRVVKRL